MTATTHHHQTRSIDLAGMTLDAATELVAEVTVLEARKFEYALLWAQLHPGDQVDTTVVWEERDLHIAGDGAPTMAEFAIADFALAMSMSTLAGRSYLGDAIETHYRLPRLWARVVAGEVPVWKARKVAQHTRSLPADGAGYVDDQIAPVAHKCSYAQIETTTDHARTKYDPDQAEAKRAEQAETRHLDLDFRNTTDNGGLVHLEGTLDQADALALEALIAAKAHELLATYPDLPLDVRRSKAAGQLGNPGSGSTSGGVSRELVIHTHHDTASSSGLVGVENTRSWITIEQLTEWCQTAGTRVTIRPILDLNTELRTDSYTPTPRQQEQAIQLNPTCVFPHCTRDSRHLDLDHIIEWLKDGTGGQTESWNLAPLCRSHHRLKTFTNWTYIRTGPRSFTWTSPTGRTYQSGTGEHRTR